MPLWFAAFLGLVQGLTEFLPISSTAHLRIAPALLGQPDPGAAYSAVIQLGTLLAVLIYLARDLFIDVPRAVLRDRASATARLPIYLVVGTVPIVVIGLLLKDYVEGEFRSLYVVAGALITVGAVMYAVDRRARNTRLIESITGLDAFLIGCAQACAVVPGVSRSGSTIACALVLGISRPDAARFSFLLGIPAIAGAGILELREVMAELGANALAPVVVGTAVAAVSGYASIAWLLRFLQRRSLVPFAIYRITLGIILITLCITAVLAPGSGL